MIVDTDILIWAMRGNIEASEYLDSIEDIFISDTTYMELVQGTKNKKEFRNLCKTLKEMNIRRIPIDIDISEKAVLLVENFAHSHSMQLADALIGATAIKNNMPFSTGNKKHFEQIPHLDLHIFKISSK